MIQTTVTNDSILKQLDQDVILKTGNTIEMGRQVIEHSKLRMIDSISRRDSARTEERLKSDTSKAKSLVNQSMQRVVEKTRTTDTFSIDSGMEIKPREVRQLIEEIPKSEIILPEKKIVRDYPDWGIGVFIVAFVIFASVKLFFNKYLSQLLNATVNYATAARMFRERSLNLAHASFRLDLHFGLIFSYFLFQLGNEYGFSFGFSSALNYLMIFAFVVAYFFGKRICYMIIGFISGSMLDTQEHLYNVNVYNRVLGLFLLPVSLTINFASLSNPRILFVVGVTITFLFYFLSLFRGSRILLRKHFSIFYLILYLCTLEILPLVFISKLLLG